MARFLMYAGGIVAGVFLLTLSFIVGVATGEKVQEHKVKELEADNARLKVDLGEAQSPSYRGHGGHWRR